MPFRELLVADTDEAALSPSLKGGLAVAVVLVVAIAGIMSGLTLGLVSRVYPSLWLYRPLYRPLKCSVHALCLRLSHTAVCVCQQLPLTSFRGLRLSVVASCAGWCWAWCVGCFSMFIAVLCCL